jgi:hypothetical protein
VALRCYRPRVSRSISDIDPVARRAAAAAAFNDTWALLERTDRSPADDDMMVHAAHASRFLWEDVGGSTQHARGEWQVSRVYAILDRAEPALHHARRCLDLCESNGIGGFDLGFAYEALARAHSIAGDRAEAGRCAARARELADSVDDEEDRRLLLDDLATLA